MPIKLINLSLQLITKEIDDVLADYPEKPYQVFFSSPFWYDKLTLFVFNQIKSEGIFAYENNNFLLEDSNFWYFPVEARLHIENIILEAMIYLEKIAQSQQSQETHFLEHEILLSF